MKDKLDIRLRIGSTSLSLNIFPEEEAMLREAAKEVNHAYDNYRKRFASSPSDEILAKVTLLFAKGYLSLSARAKELDTMLGDFENRLDRLLENQA